MGKSRQCTAITKTSPFLFIQSWDNFHSVLHKIFTMESNGFYSKPNIGLWKNNPFLLSQGQVWMFFMSVQVSQIKLCLQHFISEVLSMVMVYNSVFCLTVRWKIKFRNQGHKATLKLSLVSVFDIIFLGTYHHKFVCIYNFRDLVSLHFTSEKFSSLSPLCLFSKLNNRKLGPPSAWSQAMSSWFRILSRISEV